MTARKEVRRDVPRSTRTRSSVGLRPTGWWVTPQTARLTHPTIVQSLGGFRFAVSGLHSLSRSDQRLPAHAQRLAGEQQVIGADQRRPVERAHHDGDAVVLDRVVDALERDRDQELPVVDRAVEQRVERTERIDNLVIDLEADAVYPDLMRAIEPTGWTVISTTETEYDEIGRVVDLNSRDPKLATSLAVWGADMRRAVLLKARDEFQFVALAREVLA